MSYLELAKKSIENFSITKTHYSTDFNHNEIEVCGDGDIYFKGEKLNAKININFGDTKGNKVFIGKNFMGGVSAVFRGDNSILFIGDECTFNDVQIRSCQNKDFIAIGNQVTVTSTNVWISGNGAGESNPAIIIGDDCMFAYDIVIRNSDAHYIYELSTDEHLNKPKGIVHIEPHVWICEQVSILKSVTIGACSILSLGCIVTKDIPRFSIASGVPAISKANSEIYWARNNSEQAKDRAMFYSNKYKTL